MGVSISLPLALLVLKLTGQSRPDPPVILCVRPRVLHLVFDLEGTLSSVGAGWRVCVKAEVTTTKRGGAKNGER